jgi:adenosylhomocysteine nucleosidase
MTLRYHKIGIIGALDEEVDELVKNLIPNPLTLVPAQTYDMGTCFYDGQIGKQEVVVVKCGVGKVNAAIATQRLIDNFGCDAVMKIGVAGAVAPEVKKNDIVISQDMLEHDMDAFDQPGVIPNMDSSVFVADNALIEAAKQACEKVIGPERYHVGRHVSGDQFICTNEKKEWLKRTFGALSAEMEGAALAHTAVVNKVPFVVLSSISDLADDDAVESFEETKDEAVDYTSAVVLQMLR